jgi:SAM-dependent methyltransferase
MDPVEYRIMSEAEERHWWYLGLRDAMARALSRPDMMSSPHPKVLDAGCGTGENLRFLRRLLTPAYLGGFDLSDEALQFAREKEPGADLYLSDIRDPEIRADGLDLVISLDVIYIPGARRSMDGLQRLVGALKPGGLFVVNLPAYDWLFSEHDLAIGTTERYTTGRAYRLLRALGLNVELLTYRLCLLFPAVVLARLPGMVRARRRPRPGSPRSDLHRVPWDLTNRILHRIVQLENPWIARGIRLPWGSSVFAVGRKP